MSKLFVDSAGRRGPSPLPEGLARAAGPGEAGGGLPPGPVGGPGLGGREPRPLAGPLRAPGHGRRLARDRDDGGLAVPFPADRPPGPGLAAEGLVEGPERAPDDRRAPRLME